LDGAETEQGEVSNQSRTKKGLPAHLVGINERRRAAGLPVGRPKGVPNKITEHVRKAVLHVYSEIGGDEEFARWARDHRTDFYNLMVKLAPKEREANSLGTGIQIVINDQPRELDVRRIVADQPAE